MKANIFPYYIYLITLVTSYLHAASELKEHIVKLIILLAIRGKKILISINTEMLNIKANQSTNNIQ